MNSFISAKVPAFKSDYRDYVVAINDLKPIWFSCAGIWKACGSVWKWWMFIWGHFGCHQVVPDCHNTIQVLTKIGIFINQQHINRYILDQFIQNDTSKETKFLWEWENHRVLFKENMKNKEQNTYWYFLYTLRECLERNDYIQSFFFSSIT